VGVYTDWPDWRAVARIGESVANRYTVHLPSDGKKQTKEQVLAEAGISTTSANRYEQLVGRCEG
jgi:hypothetical protein